MKTIKPYLFCRLSEPELFLPFHSRASRTGGVVCLDLEDSVADEDKTISATLKEVQRAKIGGLLNRMESEESDAIIGLRINSPGSGFYREDLLMLAGKHIVKSIFLPKTESSCDLQKFLCDVDFTFSELIPVIETERAFQNLDDILSVTDERVKSVAFGHCDYNLSKGLFPFHHQDSNEYWDWIGFLNDRLNRNGKGLINSPILRLEDFKLFHFVLNKLQSFVSATGQITLTLKQTGICTRVAFEENGVFDYYSYRPAALDRAKEILDLFEKYQISGKSFALDDKREIISPQEYSAARKFLEGQVIS